MDTRKVRLREMGAVRAVARVTGGELSTTHVRWYGDFSMTWGPPQTTQRTTKVRGSLSDVTKVPPRRH